MTNIDLVVCGVGAGATYVYDGESSSSFVLRVDGRPLLLLDCGTGAVQSVFTHVGCLPDHVYVSHNHTDHAGDLPVMLAVEAQKGHRMTLVAENNVLNTLMAHRLHELHSTGREFQDYGNFQGCQSGQLHHLPGGVSLLPLKSRHAERCFGLVLYHQGQPVMGWSGDSGYDAALYTALSAAPVLLLDGRAKGTSEHAGFSQLAAAASSGLFGSSKVYVYGYGTLQEAPRPEDYPCLTAVVPGSVLLLTSTPQSVVPAAPAQPAVGEFTAQMAAAAAAAAAAEATAAAEAAALVAAATTAAAGLAGAGGALPADIVMQDSQVPAADQLVVRVQQPNTAAAAAASPTVSNTPSANDSQLLAVDRSGLSTPGYPRLLATGDPAAALSGAAGCMAGWPGAQLQQQTHCLHQQPEVQVWQHALRHGQQHMGRQPAVNSLVCRYGHHVAPDGMAGTGVRRQLQGVSTITSTSSSTAV